MRIAPDLHLTYCTNIHAGNGLETVVASVQRYGKLLKAALSPDAPFGIGLRLSGTESQEAREARGVALLRDVLEREGLYVFTMNGFPYGPFHDRPIKDDVHRPDWRDPERIRYTLRLAHILSDLLPTGIEGGISTSPLSYKPWLGVVSRETWTTFVRHLVEVVAELVDIREQTEQLIHLDIEPEPDGLLETSSELATFFNDWLLPVGGRLLGEQLGTSAETAEALLLEHVRVCLDTCHVAVAFESVREVLQRYRSHHIRVGKIQISSAIKVTLDDERDVVESALAPFIEPVYLHQVVQRNHDGTFKAYRDLDEALPHIYDECAAEWRIHYHVPIFLGTYGCVHSTRDTIEDTFSLLDSIPHVQHLEIETYTWGVLPSHLKRPLAASIQREFEWVQTALGSEMHAGEQRV